MNKLVRLEELKAFNTINRVNDFFVKTLGEEIQIRIKSHLS